METLPMELVNHIMSFAYYYPNVSADWVFIYDMAKQDLKREIDWLGKKPPFLSWGSKMADASNPEIHFLHTICKEAFIQSMYTRVKFTASCAVKHSLNQKNTQETDRRKTIKAYLLKHLPKDPTIKVDGNLITIRPHNPILLKDYLQCFDVFTSNMYMNSCITLFTDETREGKYWHPIQYERLKAKAHIKILFYD